MKQFNLIGVDVSDSSIKVLQLNDENSIVACGIKSLPKGVVEKGQIMDVEAFSAILNEILETTKPQILETEKTNLRTVLCLPESKLFSHHCIVPDSVKQKELKDYILSDAQKIIPFELDTLYWNYHVAKENGVRNATFNGVVKADLDNYVKAFSYAKLKPACVSGELFSLGCSLLPNPPLEEDYLIVDTGAHSTTIGIFGVDAVANLSIIIPLAGDYLSQFLAERIGVSLEEAEHLKRQFGVSTTSEDTRVPIIIREAMLPIIDKIIEAKSYFEAKTGNPIKHLILAGGSALLPQIQDFFSEKIGIEARIANPFLKIKDHELLGEDTPGIFFANVVGLALLATRADFSHLNLLTQYRYDEDSVEKEVLSIREVRSVSDFYYVIHSYLLRVKAVMLSKHATPILALRAIPDIPEFTSFAGPNEPRATPVLPGLAEPFYAGTQRGGFRF